MEKNRDYFNEIAENWDDMRTAFFSEQVREFAYSMADISTGKIAADLGAGTGFMTEGLLKAGLNVVAIDQSENMLDYMKQKFKEYSTFTCLLGDSDSIPLANNSVDYVFANMFLHHVVDPLIVIKEMYRILRTDGKLVITDLDEHHFTFLKTEQHDVWMGFNRNNLEEWFKAAGFINVNITCVGCNCCSEAKESNEKANVSIFAAYGIK